MKNRVFKNIKNVVSHPIVSLKYLLNSKKDSEKKEKRTLKNIKNFISHPIVSIKYAINKKKATKVEEEFIDELEEEDDILDDSSLEDEENNSEIEENNSEIYNKEVSWNINFETFLKSSPMTDVQKNIVRSKINKVMIEYPELKDDLIDMLNEKENSNKFFYEVSEMIEKLSEKGLENHVDDVVNSNLIEKNEQESVIESFEDLHSNDGIIDVIALDEENKGKNTVEPVKKEKIDKKENKKNSNLLESDPTVSEDLEKELRKDILNKYTQKELEEKVAKYESKITENKMLIELCDDDALKAKLNKKLNKHILKLQSYKLKLRLYVDETIKLVDEIDKENNKEVIKEQRKEEYEKEIARAKDKAEAMQFWYNVKDEDLSNLQVYNDEEINDYIENGINSKIGNDAIKSLLINNPNIKLK